MSNTSNEYKKLLQYLENKQSKTNTDLTKKKVTKTKQLLDSSTISEFSDIHCMNKSDITSGFDVSKFENLMRIKLVDERKRLQSYERPYISVSELYTCLRQCYFQRKKYSVNNKNQFYFSYLYMIQKIGNAVHDIIQTMYDFDEVEKSIISEKYKTKGRVDAIKDNCVCEIKTLDDSKFKKTYIKNHYTQANIYAFILNTEYDYDIKKVTIIYVLRSLKKIHPYTLDINNDAAIKYLENALILHSCLQKNKVPDKIGADKEQCKYCIYKEICQTNNIEQKQVNYKEPIFLL